MKKILALLLTLSLCFGTATTAFAYGGEYDIGGEGEMELLGQVYSSYDISIPSFLDTNNPEGSYISLINPNLAYHNRVEVSVTNLNEDGYVELTLDSDTKSGTAYCELHTKDGSAVTLSNPVLASISDADVDAGNTEAFFSGQIVSGTTAGFYKGTIRYSFRCNPY